MACLKSHHFSFVLESRLLGTFSIWRHSDPTGPSQQLGIEYTIQGTFPFFRERFSLTLRAAVEKLRALFGNEINRQVFEDGLRRLTHDGKFVEGWTHSKKNRFIGDLIAAGMFWSDIGQDGFQVDSTSGRPGDLLAGA